MMRGKSSKVTRACVGSRVIEMIMLVLLASCWGGIALNACAMSALISVQGQSLNQIPVLGQPAAYTEYNDPWDYVTLVMANSSEYTNDDGYGVVAYADNDFLLEPRQTWYKRVKAAQDFGNVYYTGHYLNGYGAETPYPYDVLDNALYYIMNGDDDPAIVMAHARNASGYTYGNHPFWFHYRDRTYTFMHNGNCNAARSYMINRVHQLHPDDNWFIRHPSNYFEQTNPYLWVDTEVMFHYLMAHIVANRGDVVAGLNVALAGIRTYVENPYSGVYNFIMSDGEKLYVFRSTPTTGPNSHYRLSYRYYRDQFYGVRTLNPGVSDRELQACELVVLSRDEAPLHIGDVTYVNLQNAGPPDEVLYTRQRIPWIVPEIVVSPNPMKDDAVMRVSVSTAGLLKAAVYNLRGERVWHKDQDVNAPGIKLIAWDGRDDRGRKLPAGNYLVRIRSGKDVSEGRITLVP